MRALEVPQPTLLSENPQQNQRFLARYGFRAFTPLARWVSMLTTIQHRTLDAIEAELVVLQLTRDDHPGDRSQEPRDSSSTLPRAEARVLAACLYQGRQLSVGRFEPVDGSHVQFSCASQQTTIKTSTRMSLVRR